MTPTRPSLLVALALIALVLGVAVADLYDTLVGLRLPVPWTTAVTLIAIDIGLLGWTLVFRNRLKREGIHVNPFVAMRTAALAMATSRAGALVVGFFAGVAFWYALDLSIAIARERLVISGVCAVAGVVLVVVALWLERICRLPKDPDDPDRLALEDEPGSDWVHPRDSVEHPRVSGHR